MRVPGSNFRRIFYRPFLRVVATGGWEIPVFLAMARRLSTPFHKYGSVCWGRDGPIPLLLLLADVPDIDSSSRLDLGSVALPTNATVFMKGSTKALKRTGNPAMMDSRFPRPALDRKADEATSAPGSLVLWETQ